MSTKIDIIQILDIMIELEKADDALDSSSVKELEEIKKMSP